MHYSFVIKHRNKNKNKKKYRGRKRAKETNLFEDSQWKWHSFTVFPFLLVERNRAQMFYRIGVIRNFTKFTNRQWVRFSVNTFTLYLQLTLPMHSGEMEVLLKLNFASGHKFSFRIIWKYNYFNMLLRKWPHFELSQTLQVGILGFKYNYLWASNDQLETLAS